MITLTTTIHLIDGHNPTLAALQAPLWTGTLEQFWQDNQDSLTFLDIRAVSSEITDAGEHRMGGGASPAMTLLSDYGLRCAIARRKLAA